MGPLGEVIPESENTSPSEGVQWDMFDPVPEMMMGCNLGGWSGQSGAFSRRMLRGKTTNES